MARIVVIGGTGLIGSKVVTKLANDGHEAVAASPSSGVNSVTGDGVADVLTGAEVVVDVSNAPSFEEPAVFDFFTTSTTNLLHAAGAANVANYVALSVFGAPRLTDGPYLRAKAAQEELIEKWGVDYSIVEATQFFEFVDGIADAATVGGVVRASHALIQPIAAEDVATAVSQTAMREPVNGVVEVAGPEQFGVDDLIRKALSFHGDQREVVTDPEARYFGALLGERSLVPGDNAVIFETRFDDWLAERAG
jgi:uncharacterized protein YbjT (DUF2867 family)